MLLSSKYLRYGGAVTCNKRMKRSITALVILPGRLGSMENTPKQKVGPVVHPQKNKNNMGCLKMCFEDILRLKNIFKSNI